MQKALLSLLLFIPFFSCSFPSHDTRLSQIAQTLENNPEKALAELDSLHYNSLSVVDRHYYDFLTLKAKDKTYITHTSDSLFLNILNYYSQSPGDKIYPEVLYYGGRVYSDLGDAATALNYYHQALDILYDKTDNYNLKARALSQTGRLLTSMRLYNQALSYIRESVNLLRTLNDTANLIFDLQLMGGTYLQSEKFDSAEIYFTESLRLAEKINSKKQIAKSQMYLAEVKHKQHDFPSAVNLIRNIIDEVSGLARNSALAYASRIYLDASIPDTSYLMALELISSPDPTHHEIGYNTLLDARLRGFSPHDSIDSYIDRYCNILESFYDDNQNQLAINQQAFYNYHLHDRERKKIQKDNQWLVSGITIALLIIIIMMEVVFTLKYREKKRIRELDTALENLKILKKMLASDSSNFPYPITHSIDTELFSPSQSSAEPKKTEHSLREELKNRLLDLYHNSSEKPVIAERILQSKPYQDILSKLATNTPLADNSDLWDEIEKVILEVSPNFKSNLSLLSSGNLTTVDIHTALLIKCGFKPSQMTIILARSNGAIISRRESLCIKVLGKKLGVKVIDHIIRLL